MKNLQTSRDGNADCRFLPSFLLLFHYRCGCRYPLPPPLLQFRSLVRLLQQALLSMRIRVHKPFSVPFVFFTSCCSVAFGYQLMSKLCAMRETRRHPAENRERIARLLFTI